MATASGVLALTSRDLGGHADVGITAELTATTAEVFIKIRRDTNVDGGYAAIRTVY